MAEDVRIEQLWIPDSLDGPDSADFLAAVEVGRKVRMQTWGSDDLAYTPLEKLLELADPYERQVILVAKIDGDIVGAVDIALPLADNLDLAEFTLDILPEFQRQGVGTPAAGGSGAVCPGRRPDHDPDRHQSSRSRR